jgi:methyl-accepting chemotaxis protein
MLDKLKMSQKLIGGFVIVALILGLAILYQSLGMKNLAELQDEGAGRADDAVEIGSIMEVLAASYSIIGDGIINGDMDATHADFAEFKAQANKDMDRVDELVDHDEERRAARELRAEYTAYYTTFEDQMLPILDRRLDLSEIMHDTMEVSNIMTRVNGLYEIIADAIINRNLSESKGLFATAKSQANTDISTILAITGTGTGAEKAMGQQFSSSYNTYLGLWNDLMTILAAGEYADMEAIRELDGRIDGIRDQTREPLQSILDAHESEAKQAAVDMKKIRELDELIDQKLTASDVALEKIVDSLHEEMVAGDAAYDATSKRTILIATIVGIGGLVIALLIGFLLTNAIAKPINATVKDMTSGAEQVSGAAGQVSSSSQSLAEGASEQAASLEETSASMEEMTSMTKQNADNASQADSLMREVLLVITTADKSMDEMSLSMEDISAASEETSKIVKTIDEIAFQTNLPALNAAVEAARAGEAGAGFAVVADEVRNLAMRAAEAAKNTAELIEGIVTKVNSGKDIVTKTNSAFKEVSESSSKVGGLVGEISAASKEQSTGFGQISQAITQMDSVTQQNSATAEESAAASEELNAQAEVMLGVVGGLRALVEGAGNSQSQGRRQTMRQTVSSPNRGAKALRRPALAAPKGSAKKDPNEIIPMDDDDFEDF